MSAVSRCHDVKVFRFADSSGWCGQGRRSLTVVETSRSQQFDSTTCKPVYGSSRVLQSHTFRAVCHHASHAVERMMQHAQLGTAAARLARVACMT